MKVTKFHHEKLPTIFTRVENISLRSTRCSKKINSTTHRVRK